MSENTGKERDDRGGGSGDAAKPSGGTPAKDGPEAAKPGPGDIKPGTPPSSPPAGGSAGPGAGLPPSAPPAAKPAEARPAAASPTGAAKPAEAPPQPKPADKTADRPTAAKPADAPGAAKPEAKPAAKPSAKPAEKAARRGGGLSTVFWTLVVVVVIGVAGVVTWPRWSAEVEPYAKPYFPRLFVDTEAEAARLAALDDRLAAVEGTLGEDADAISALKAERDALGAELEAVMGRVDDLEKSLAEIRALAEAAGAAGGTGDVGGLVERLDRLEGEVASADALTARMQALETRTTVVSNGNATAAATALAIGQLREALTDSGPFDDALAAVRALAAGDTALEQAMAALEPHAATGIPTLADLRGRFPAVAAAMAGAEDQQAGDDALVRAWTRLKSLVTVRRVGDAAVEAGGLSGALVRAEALMASGDLAGAADVVGAVEGPALEAAGDWLAGARARLAADEALSAMQARAVVLLTAAEG